MKKISIGFSKPKNVFFPVFSYIIRAVYNTEYSHTYIRYHSDDLQRDIIYEAVGKGVRFIGLTNWLKHAEVVDEFSIEIPEEQYDNLMKYCIDEAGLDYGLVQCVGILVVELLSKVGVILNKNPFPGHSMDRICSEEVSNVLKSIGIVIKKDRNLISPKDIYEALSHVNT